MKDSTITRRDRVRTALLHKDTDIVPYHVDFTKQEFDRIADDLGDSEFEKKYGFHLYPYQWCGWPTAIPGKRELFRDSYGVVWNRSGVDKDIGVIDGLLIEDIEDYDYVIPTLDEKRVRAEIEAHLAEAGDRFTVVGIGFLLFERAWTLHGMENVLADMLLAPTALEELMEKICEFNLHFIDIITEYGVDSVYFGDDWGQQHGLIMGKEHWNRFIRPYLRRMYDRAKSKGLFIIQHSCGDCSEILGDLIDIGLDCYQTFQPEIYDIVRFKREYGDHLSVWGGISTQQLLPKASPEKVYSETKRIMEIMSRGGGYIASPTHAMPGDIPTENFLAMTKAFLEQ